MPTSSVRSCNAPRNFWFSAVFSFNWVNTEGHRCKRSAAIRKRVLSCRGQFKFSIQIKPRLDHELDTWDHLLFPTTLKTGPVPLNQVLKMSDLANVGIFACVCFLSVNLNKSNLQNPLQTGGGKEQSRHKGDVSNQSGEMSLWLLQPSALIG